MKTRHNLYADDAFLFFGLTCMCVATALAYSMISTWYLQETMIYRPEKPLLSPKELSKFIQDKKIIFVCVVLSWTAEFSVKMSLLLFSKQLVNRLPRLTLYVKFVMAFTVVVWAVLICEPFISCPYFRMPNLGKSPMYYIFLRTVLIGRGYSAKCANSKVSRTVGFTAFIITLDILTDIMSTIDRRRYT